ncbi:MAG: thioredoxin [Miltoncostaeaceae bacterium]
MSDLPAVTEGTWNDLVLGQDEPVLVDFWATWCKPCAALEPTIAEMAERYRGRMEVVAVNVDENPGVASSNAVLSLPTLILFKDGSEIERVVGNVRPKKLDKALAKHLG